MEVENQKSFYKWVALGVVVIGTFMAILDSSIVNIAIPKMMAVFGVSLDKVKWILTSYMLTLGAVIPLTGYLGDTFGNKKLYIFSLAVFTIGSLFCGLAWNITSMIVARVIQGIGGGMIMPVSMAIIYEIIPKEERGMALGFWGIAAMAAPAIGPTLSGYIIEHLDWRLIFTINIPIGIIGVVLSLILLRGTPMKLGKKFDYLGVITSVLGLISILYVLGKGSNIDWGDIKNIMLLIFGVFNLILFVINELTIDEPLLDLRVLKIFPFSLSIIISSMLNMAMYGGVLILPLFLQNLRGYSAMQTGVLMFPSAIATGIMMPISGKLFDKFGAKPLVVPGVALLAATTYELSRITMETPPHTITWILVIRGIALGLTMMPSTTAGMNCVPTHLVTRASALSNTIRQVAGSLSVTILTIILQRRQDLSYYRLIEQVSSFNPLSLDFIKYTQSQLVQAGMSLSQAQASSSALLYGEIQKKAYLFAINDTLLVTVFAALIVIPFAMMIKSKKSDKIHDESKTKGDVDDAIIS